MGIKVNKFKKYIDLKNHMGLKKSSELKKYSESKNSWGYDKLRHIAKIMLYLSLASVLAGAMLTGCGPSQAEIDESIALESAQARLSKAESEYESVEESIAESKAAAAAEKNKPAFYEPTDDEKELICKDWYRSKDNGQGDTDLYWLTMNDNGYCHFAHETLNTEGYIDELDGTWSVDDHGFVRIDLGKYSGKFRFLENAYGSTNIICADGDDFVESGDEGAYAAFVPVKWYRGNLRFIDNKDAEKETASDTAASDTTASDATASDATASDATASDATASDAADNMVIIEMQGEGDSWFRLAGVKSMCKVDTDTRDGEILARIAVNQNDHLIVKIQQIR